MKLALNVVGPQVRKFRNLKGWTQAVLAQKLQLQGWSISLGSMGKLEAQLRRVPDCELMFLAKVLGVSANDFLPKKVSLKQIGPQFQSGKRLALFQRVGKNSPYPLTSSGVWQQGASIPLRQCQVRRQVSKSHNL